jgi:hypothetical protein
MQTQASSNEANVTREAGRGGQENVCSNHNPSTQYGKKFKKGESKSLLSPLQPKCHTQVLFLQSKRSRAFINFSWSLLSLPRTSDGAPYPVDSD